MWFSKKGGSGTKLKENVDFSELLELGFVETVESDAAYQNYWGEFDTNFINKYAFELGHSRRGQFYYILVDKGSREISIYSTKPDGDGGELYLDSVYGIFSKLLEKVEAE